MRNPKIGKGKSRVRGEKKCLNLLLLFNLWIYVYMHVRVYSCIYVSVYTQTHLTSIENEDHFDLNKRFGLHTKKPSKLKQ